MYGALRPWRQKNKQNRTTQTNLKNSKNSELNLELEGWNLAQRPRMWDTIPDFKKKKEKKGIGRLEMR